VTWQIRRNGVLWRTVLRSLPIRTVPWLLGRGHGFFFFASALIKKRNHNYNFYLYKTLSCQLSLLAVVSYINSHSAMLWCWVYQSVYVMKINLMHYLSSFYFVNQPLHVSGIFVARHQEVDCLLAMANRQSTKKHNTNQLLYIYKYSIPPDDGLQICPKYIEVDWRNKLSINSAWSWFLLQRNIEVYGQQNIKKFTTAVISRIICKAITVHIFFVSR